MVGNNPVGYWDILGYVDIITAKPKYLCLIDIFVGHGGALEDGTIDQAVFNARKKADLDNQGLGRDKSSYRIGGVGCRDKRVKSYAGKYNFENSNRTTGLRYGPFLVYKALLKEIEAAKSTANREMCNTPPACCKTVRIRIKYLTGVGLHMGSWNSANWLRLFFPDLNETMVCPKTK